AKPWEIVFHVDGRRLFLLADAIVHVYDLVSGKEERKSPARFRDGRVAAAPDGKWGAIATIHQPAEIVDLTTWKTVALVPDAGQTTAVAWAPAGQAGSRGSPLVAFGNQDGGIYLFDVERR